MVLWTTDKTCFLHHISNSRNDTELSSITWSMLCVVTVLPRSFSHITKWHTHKKSLGSGVIQLYEFDLMHFIQLTASQQTNDLDRPLLLPSKFVRNLQGSGMSQALTASPKPPLRASWRVGDTVVNRGKAGWTTSKSGHPCPCQNCSQGPPAEKNWRKSRLNRPSCPPPTTQSMKGLNWTELKRICVQFARKMQRRISDA